MPSFSPHFATVFHELRVPMQTISLSLEDMRADFQSVAQQQSTASSAMASSVVAASVADGGASLTRLHLPPQPADGKATPEIGNQTSGSTGSEPDVTAGPVGPSPAAAGGGGQHQDEEDRPLVASCGSTLTPFAGASNSNGVFVPPPPPLSAGCGHEEFIQRSEETLHVMSSAVASARHVIDSTLEIERIDEGLLVVEFRPTSMRTCLESLYGEMQPLARSAGITHFSLTMPSLEEVAAVGLPANGATYNDVGKMKQVVRNLLSNAIKFTPRGGSVIARVSIVNVQTLPMPAPPPPSYWKDEGDRRYAELMAGQMQSPIAAAAASRGACALPDTYPVSHELCRYFFHFTPDRQAQYRFAGPSEFVPTEFVANVRIEVKDSGCGMTGEEIAKLFQPFV